MQEAVSLARLAQGEVSPNPAVGAVLVKEGAIVGRGYTQPPGQDHAEIVALKQAGDDARGASLYVTLEPCCHHGRTPPCTDAIIAAGVSEVHMAMHDPNPLVSGQGCSRLEEAGIETEVGDCAEETAEMLEAYKKHITTGLPFVTAKFAMSLDGKIATITGDSKWISGESSRAYSHNLRHQSDAIMVGINTVLRDDPQLTVRCASGRGGASHHQPVRVIVDSYGRTPLDARILHETGRTLIAVGAHISAENRRSLQEADAELLEIPVINGFLDLAALLRELGAREITSILVEGGSSLLGSMFDFKLVDKVVAFVAPVVIGGENAKTPVGGRGVDAMANAFRLNNVRVEQLDSDIMIQGYMEA